MPKTTFVKGLHRLRRWLRDRRDRGFTLLELLISIIIGAIITLGLLSLVVDLTKTNQVDTARSETQREMQAAIDYISQDLREAVYVYNGYCLTEGTTAALTTSNFLTECPRLVNYLPSGLRPSATFTPVLAFWKSEPLPDGIQRLCRTAAGQVDSTNANNTSATSPDPKNPLWVVESQGVPCKSGNSYNLLVYGLDSSASNIWKGKARLVRFRLSQFLDGDTTATPTVNGWGNPQRFLTSRFTQWPFWLPPSSTQPEDGRNTSSKEPPSPEVLVDFVDDVGVRDSSGNGVNPGANNNSNCQPYTVQAALSDDARDRSIPILTPHTATNRAFYACVTGGSPKQDASGNPNQQVFMSLVGNIAGRPGFPKDSGNDAARGRTSPIQTQVLVRGAINKRPSS